MRFNIDCSWLAGGTRLFPLARLHLPPLPPHGVTTLPPLLHCRIVTAVKVNRRLLWPLFRDPIGGTSGQGLLVGWLWGVLSDVEAGNATPTLLHANATSNSKFN